MFSFLRIWKRWLVNIDILKPCFISRISNLWETKIRKNICQRKTITRTRKYLGGSTICLRLRNCRDFTIIREKIQVRQYSVFSLSKNNNNKNPNHQKTFSTSCAQAWAYRLKSPLYRLSLRKSPIKKSRNIIRVRSSRQPD